MVLLNQPECTRSMCCARRKLGLIVGVTPTEKEQRVKDDQATGTIGRVYRAKWHEKNSLECAMTIRQQWLNVTCVPQPGAYCTVTCKEYIPLYV